MRRRRPNTLLGLSLRVLLTYPGRAAAVLGVLALAVVVGRGTCAGGPIRVATFNIENYPRSPAQEEGAFRTLREMDAPLVAVQEITDPPAFTRAARRELGPEWRFAYSEIETRQRVGTLYDSDVLRLDWSRSHDVTIIDGHGRPAFEARFTRDDGDAIRLVVVHLKAGGDSHDIRREQIRRLTPVLRAAASSPDELLVLGDFNATGDDDRTMIGALSEDLGLKWASEPLRCTAYWNRRDGCIGSSLDHVLTREVPSDIRARGPCESIGCEPGDRCPAFHREVSDHCPVTIDLP